jgi:prepilin-type processing-associated H-X9-DG protein
MKTYDNSAVDRPIRRSEGFTIVDLAVVIATLGILAVLVLPALASTKTDSTAFQCENNMKQLATAWTMYAAEANDLLCNLSTYQDSYTRDVANYKYGTPWRSSISCCQYTPAMLPTGGLEAQHKWIAELGFTHPTAVIEGPLYRFCKNADLIQCPADYRASLKDSAGYQGPYTWGSYGGSGNLNGESRPEPQCIYKLSAITRPKDKFVWAEEADNRGENLGSWWMGNYGTHTRTNASIINWNTATFSDPPAAFHVGAANFNFCDGHVEQHNWLNSATIAYANSLTLDKDVSTAPQDARGRLPGNVDAIWVAMHYAGTQNP